MNNNEEENSIISTIRKITSSLFISHYEGSELSLAYEDPDYGIRRVMKQRMSKHTALLPLMTVKYFILNVQIKSI
ncbi:hypothetical protein H1230_16835 [Paenibacillus sp. 19GGS1-52]|uniref:hypothetical protein n=1 Tax=Paenibacillus sp. 19GGS1-52 TaxID=2758563 RepID=UPI001EFA3230|nr:hypothetical protein [Paenibacillus sp. 19GGS1-52]ULO04813.1 hypothetical protein H1230_16835 [Paenibacillus sp. 19GGS1-52]